MNFPFFCYPTFRLYLHCACLFVILFIAAHVLPAASQESGLPYLKNYPPAEHGGHNQNWGIAQDRNGIMYFANNLVVLEYDGVRWRRIQMPNKGTVRSVAVDASNRIYAGGFGDLGYLAPDSIGQLRIISMLAKVDSSRRDFNNVLQILVTDSGIYFITEKYLFRWRENRFNAWPAQTTFHIGFWVNGQLYLRQREVGLQRLIGDSLEMAPKGEHFTGEGIQAMLPFDEKRILLVQRTQGLLLFDGQTLQPFPTEVDDLLREAQTSCGVNLPNGNFAIGTMRKGIIVIDRSGRLQYVLNKSTGLQDAKVHALFVDKQDGLWAALNTGISRIEAASPLTMFDDRLGSEGSVYDILGHRGELYIATSMGIYYLDENLSNARRRASAGKHPWQFTLVEGIPPTCFALLSAGQTLLGATGYGVYEIKNHRANLIDNNQAFSLGRSRQDSNRVFVGLANGLKTLYFSQGKWRYEEKIAGVNERIRRVWEDNEGRLWLSAQLAGALRVDFSNGFNPAPAIVRFDTSSGLPSLNWCHPFFAARKILFGTANGIFGFDESRQRFFPDTTLGKMHTKGRWRVEYIIEDRRGDVWIASRENSGVARRRLNGHFLWEQASQRRFADIDPYVVYPESARDSVVWYGFFDRMIRYDETVRHNYGAGFSALVRQVIVNGDSIIFGGANFPNANFLPTLGSQHNALRFVSAAPSFDQESKNRFQYFLEGFDEGWSSWSDEAQKDYTNLPDGEYRFHVRAKNIYDRQSDEAVFAFRILPPVYKTWWAYGVYGMLFLGVLYGLRRIEIKRERRKYRHELQRAEFVKLQELDRLKSRFFADISHEFRTPLTLILGPLQSLRQASSKTDVEKQSSIIERNALRLLRLINQVLDLSKLEAGKLRLQAASGNLIPFVKGILYSFESLAQGENITLHFKCDTDEVMLYFDPEKMEQILTNVLSNAFKFTPKGGEISVQLSVTSDQLLHDRLSTDRCLLITIKDTGSGIPPEHLPHIFERFYQIDEAYTKDQPGSGIGLALAKELVQLHKGEIRVASEVNIGTEFTILLPLGKEHLAAEDIVESVASDQLPVISEQLSVNSHQSSVISEQ